MNHPFIFSPNTWEGIGTIAFSMADDVLHFTTQWTVLPKEEGLIYFNQEIVIQTLPEKMRNHFTLYQVDPAHFEIVLENPIIGKVTGKGLITPTAVAWEFRRKDQEFEGFEIYALQKDGSYQMRAEFTGGDSMRTKIHGSIFPRPA